MEICWKARTIPDVVGQFIKPIGIGDWGVPSYLRIREQSVASDRVVTFGCRTVCQIDAYPCMHAVNGKKPFLYPCKPHGLSLLAYPDAMPMSALM